MSKARSAFTLIELLVVITILGLLAALALPNLHAFKPNVLSAAEQQLLASVARARQLAISQRTTVYMIFVPTNFWNDQYFGPVKTSVSEFAKAARLYDKQLIGYTFVALRSLGDQPGQSTPRYLAPWRTLPDGAFIPQAKFGPRITTPIPVPAIVITTNDSTSVPHPVFWDPPIVGMSTTNIIPFPSDQAPGVVDPNGVTRWATVPYIAFNYLGQVVSGLDEIIPLGKGSVTVARDTTNGVGLVGLPTVTENPPGNASNSFDVVKIEWLTGRAHAERLEIR